MSKVGFNRQFHAKWFATVRIAVLIAALLPAISAFAQPAINSPAVEAGTYGTPYIYNITTDTWPNPVDISMNFGPAWLTLVDNEDGTATLSGTPTAAGTFPIIIEVNDPSDSQASTQNFDLVISKAVLIATADGQTRFYGYNDPVFTISYSGFKFSDDATGLDTPPIASPTSNDNSSPGNHTINVSVGSALDDNYTFTPATGTLVITKAPITAGADDQSRTYGANNPALTVTYTGLQNGETGVVIDTPPQLTTAGPAANVGTYPIELNNTPADDNYAISFSPGTLTVTKAQLTATADNKTRPYASANPLLSISYTGFVNGDDVNDITVPERPTISTTAVTGSNAGPYDITVAGGNDDNYTFNYVLGTLTVTKVSLTVQADAKTRVYGAVNPPLTFTYVGFVNGDDASDITTPPQISTEADEESHVGNYDIELENGSATNYELALVPNLLSVTKAPLTITAQNQTKVYGQVNPALTVLYSGFANDDTPSVFTSPLVVSTSATTSSAVGTYGIIPSGAVASDYTINFEQGDLSVTKAVLTAKADDKSRIYGGTNPLFTVSYTGFVNGDDIGDIAPGSATSLANATTNVGSIDITPAGASATNYSFTYVSGTLTITPATVTVTAVSTSRTYGSPEPVFSATYSGFLNSETSTVLTKLPTGVTDATVLSDVGNGYHITMSGAEALNYTFTYVQGTLTITKATLTAKADDKSRAYGAANPTFTITYTGFRNSQDALVLDTKPAAGTLATPASPVGTHTISVSGGDDNNYTFTYATGVLTIDKAVLLATADNKTRAYGAANPGFTVTYSGLLNGDLPGSINATPVMSTDALVTSPVGNTYTISISGGSDDNYTFNYATGTLTITKATLTAKADDKTRAYGAGNPAFTVTYTGFLNGDDVGDIVQGTANADGVSATTDVGNYDITPKDASAVNYTFIYTKGTLAITKATLTLTANNQTRVYGAANPPLTITYSGFLNGDDPLDLNATAPAASTLASATSPVGPHTISISNGVDNNYQYVLQTGTLTITPAVLTITADNKTRVYNTANPPFTLTYSGFLNSDNVASIVPPVASTSATLTSQVGPYTISLANGSATNYTFNFVSGTLTITKATPIVTWNNPAPIVYGTPLGATQLSASANVSGEYAYTPVSGTVLNAGAGQVLKVDFTPSDLTNYNVVNNTTVTITVNKAIPVITWANPPAITYGTTLNTTNHLNATANVAGAFVYTPAAGTMLNAGANQNLKADFTPANTANYESVLNITRQITVNKATPVATWNNPAAITYGTALGATQLNATFSVAGTPTYVPGAGTILPAGANQVISVNFAPADAANYNALNGVQVLITVLKATPVITWNNPADISYGTPLTSTQLNASSGSVTGAFVYSPPSGTTLPAGSGQTLTASFTPTDPNNYNPVPSTSVTINVNKANPVITWGAPAAITYGTALSATQLNATSSVPGTFVYNPVLGTVMNAGANQTITATFTPTDQANNNAIVTTRMITVNKATPVVSWSSPAPIVYGTPLGSTQQNATANVAGTFEYTPAPGTVLTTGVNQNISVKFTPNDATNYNIVPTTTTTITVSKATPVVTWTTPLPIKVGVALSATQLNATANVAGSYAYTPAAGTSFGVEGTYTLHVNFTPADLVNYNTVPNTEVQIVVSSKENPVITWANPAAISYGTVLSATQLNASASVAGSYSYSPVSGTKLDAGTGQTLTVTFTPTDLVNYNIVNKSVNINVNKVTLTATAAPASRAYGSANPPFVINYTGFVTGDAVGVIDAQATATSVATPAAAAGSTHPIVPASGADNNYNFAYVNGTLTITKAALTATAENKTRTYGVINPAFTISYSGFVNGDDDGDITAPVVASAATLTSSVGNYPITVTGGSAANYTITNQPGTLSITKALLVVIGDELTRPYGQANPALTFKYIGFKNGDNASSVATPPTASTTATITSSAGGYTVTITGGSATNYLLQPFDGSLTITKAPLTVKADDKTRIYGQANPTFTLSYTGFRNGDDAGDVTPPTINGSAATPISPVGPYQILLSGGSAANYELNLQNGTLTVTKAILTAKAENKSRQYGLANPAFTITYTGFLNGDDQGDITAPTASTTATLTSDVNTYTITLAGGTSANYTFALQTGTLSVTPAPLTAKANDRTRTYGVGPGTPTISYTGFLNGDDAGDITPPVPATTATAASNVGTYPITLSGGSALNYTLTLQPGVFTVVKATLTVRVDNKTKTYGAANPANTLTYEGFVNGDNAGDITPPTITGPAATAASPVGTYPITLSGGTSTNYTFDPHNGNLTIEKAGLIAKADNKTRVYGAPDPAFTVTYTGFVNGDNVTDITPLTASTLAVATSNVGSYAIKVTAGVTANYLFTYQDGTLSITRKNITVKADNKSRAYGSSNPPLTLTYSGLANNESSSVIDTQPTPSTTAGPTTAANTSVAITLTGGSDNNYDLSLEAGTISITKAPLTATADNKSRPYGNANPANTITYSGFRNGETAGSITPPVATTSASETSPVGTYPIVVSGGSATNYDITSQNGTLTVARAVLSVTADSHTRPYGSPNPDLTLTYSGFKNGQGVSVIDVPPNVTTSATITSPVGEYNITAAGGSDNNYSFQYTSGKLTISKATLTATADDKQTTYGTMPELTITYTGFMNGENISVINTVPVIGTSATETSDVTTYPITLTTGSDNNYNIVTVEGTLTIDKAPLIAKADDQGRIIGFANPPLTITYTGFVNNETVDVIDTKPTASTVANTGSAPGTYPITVAGGNDNHYDFTYESGTLKVVLDTPPVAKNFTVETNEDVTIPFSLSLFETNRTDEPGGKVIYIKIVTLPVNGVLLKGIDAPVAAGEELPVTEGSFGDLFYQANSNFNGNDSFTWNLFDGTFVSAANGTISIKVKPVNDAPVLSNIEQEIISYNPGDPDVKLTEDLIINDIDDDFAFGATISIATASLSSGDLLSLTLPTGSDIELTYDQAKGELTLDGKDTRTNYQALLREITFSSPVDGGAIIGDKLVNIVVKDSVASSNIASRTISISQVFPELDIVNAFTPNGDGVNDAWDILNLESYNTININVYDLNSNKVFTCTTRDCAWDGTFKGKALSAGSYAYTIDLDNGKRTYKGIVTILK